MLGGAGVMERPCRLENEQVELLLFFTVAMIDDVDVDGGDEVTDNNDVRDVREDDR